MLSVGVFEALAVMGSGVGDDGGVIDDRHTFADSLRGVDLSAIFHGVHGEVDLGDWLLVLDSANGIVDVLIATVVAAGRLSLGIHVEVSLGRVREASTIAKGSRSTRQVYFVGIGDTTSRARFTIQALRSGRTTNTRECAGLSGLETVCKEARSVGGS